MLVLDHLLTGSISPLSADHQDVSTAIDKIQLQKAVWLDKKGFETDFQADRKNHGGKDMAVHHYPFEHYTLWHSLVKGENGNVKRLENPGGFGENFSTHNMTEQTIAIGDVFQIGSAVIEVSQGRQPCWKLAVKFNVRSMASLVQKTGMTGWYYRVLQPGKVQARDTFTLIERKSPTWTIERLNQILFNRVLDPILLKQVETLPSLSEKWQHIAQKRLDTQEVEDWTKRLNGPATL